MIPSGADVLTEEFEMDNVPSFPKTRKSGDLMNRKRPSTLTFDSTRIIPSGNGIKRNNLLTFIILLMAFSLVLSTPISSDSTDITPTKLAGLPDEGNFNYLTLADIDKDGYPDIVAGAGGYPGGSPGGLHLYLNNEGKSFTESSDGLPGPGSSYFGTVQVVDVDGDGNMDIVAAYESEWSDGDSKGIDIWLGNGGAGGKIKWTEAVSPTTSGSYDSAHCADIDSDGNLDMVGGSSDGLYAWLGDHSGSTLSWTEAFDGLPSSGEYTGVTLGDIDGDDNLDIVAGSYENRGISVYLYGGIGSLKWTDGHTGTNLKMSGKAFDNRLVDLNGDSELDLISTIRGGIIAYIGNGNSGIRSTWWTEVSDGLPTSDDYYELAVNDVDGDGKMDICSNFKAWSNTADMSDTDSYSWEPMDLDIELSEPVGIAVADVDDDGDKDIAGCGWGSGIACYLLRPDETPATEYYYIRGTVIDRDDGVGIGSASIETDDNGGYSTTTDANGDYELFVEEGEYTITVTKTGFQSMIKTASVSGDDVTLDFELVERTNPAEMEYELSGTVLDSETDVGIPGALVEIRSEGLSIMSDSSGEFTFTLTNGSYTITFSMDGYEEESVSAKIRGGDTIKDVYLTPIPGDNNIDNDIGGGSAVTYIVVFAVVGIVLLILIALILRRRG